MLHEGLLYGVELLAFRKALDGRDLLPLGGDGEDKAGCTGLPSIRTVQAPHSPSLHDFFVPVKPSVSLKTSTRVRASPR